MSVQGALDLTQFRCEEAGTTKRLRYGMYTGPKKYSNFYTNGGTGDPIVPADVKLGQIHVFSLDTAANAAGVPLAPTYISQAQGGPVGGAIIWFNWLTAAEVADGTDLSGYSAYFEATGL